MAAIQIEKPPVYGAVKGLTGLAGISPWTQAQRTAGVRREIPLGQVGGIGTNRVAPPPIPVVQPTRAALVQALTPGRGGGYDVNPATGGMGAPLASGGPGVTAISAGINNAGGGQTGLSGGSNNPANSWGRTSTGVRSSARNANGSWGNSVSNSGTGWGGWGSFFGGGGGGGSNSGGGNRGAWGNSEGYGSHGPGLW